jgi:hypothetical protein
MSTYIQFNSSNNDDSIILIEVEDSEIETDLGGTVKVGLKERVESSVAIAQETFSSAMESAIKHNVEGLISGIRALPNPPSEAEITFGLKATGEVGNVAVGKIGAETNYSIKLVWKNSTNDK